MSADRNDKGQFKVTFLHLDLGIGGAERLVVDCAVQLRQIGYDVRVLTTHHDPSHCFSETKIAGMNGLRDVIEVYGDWLPRYVDIGPLKKIFSRGTGKITDRRFNAICGIVRMMYLSAILFFKTLFAPDGIGSGHVVFLDGLSQSIPIISACGLPVLFYCHFPDALLSPINISSASDTQSSSSIAGILKRGYRDLVDWLESATMQQAALIAVNSEFTASVCKKTFKFFEQKDAPPLVTVYPAVSEVIDYEIVNDDAISYTSNYNHVFVSLNRYERKKRLDIAIDAFQILIERLKMKNISTSDILLVIAGGFDDAVEENLKVYNELVSKAEKYSLTCQVVFRKSISNDERLALLQASAALLYTPDREHFGIVPIEAMAQGIPVIAVSSGGPLETVDDGVTGYLCEQTPEAFSGAMEKFVTKDKTKKKQIDEMGLKGKERVARLFSKTALRENLESCINKILSNEKPLSLIFISIWVVVLVMFGQFIGLILKYFLRSIGVLSE